MFCIFFYIFIVKSDIYGFYIIVCVFYYFDNSFSYFIDKIICNIDIVY